MDQDGTNSTHNDDTYIEECNENEWSSAVPKPKKKMFAFDWAQGYLSPFRRTPVESLLELFESLATHNILSPSWDKHTVIDLGCGDGVVNIKLAKSLNIRGIGVDLDEKLLEQAKSLAVHEQVSDLIQWKHEDLMTTSLDDATIIFMYLLPEGLEKLRPILEKAIKERPSLVVIVGMWEFPHWDHFLTYTHDNGKFRIYMYK